MPRPSAILTAAACLLGGCQHATTAPASPPQEQASAKASASSVPPAGSPTASRHPVVVLHELNPWASVIGAEIPSFVLYDDGLVIYLEENDGGAQVQQAQLAAEQRRRLARSVFDALEQAPREVQLSHWTDQPTVRLMAQVDGRWRVTYVYGLGTDGQPSTELPPNTAPLSPDVAEAYRELRGFTADDGQRWQPERLEVMLGGFEHAKLVVPWPSDLPTPPAGLVPSDQHRVGRFEVPASHGEALQRLMASLGDRRAVAWNGHAWSVATRPVIPAQDEIQAAWR